MMKTAGYLVSSKHYIPVESFKTQVNAVAGRA